jgi:hypothetical protein
MKKQTLLTGLALLYASNNLQAHWQFEDFFRASERMMQDMQQNIKRIEDLGKMHQAQDAQPDYTLQYYTENSTYGVIIKLNGVFGKDAPKVAINTTRNSTGQLLKELEVEAVIVNEDNGAKQSEKKESYAYYTQSSTTVMRDGVITQHTSENSRAAIQNGILRIKHTLPKNVNEESYTMSFENAQLKLEFNLMKEAPKATKKSLVYTAEQK